MPTDASWDRAAQSTLKHWAWFLLLFAIEFWLAIRVPKWDVDSFAVLNALVDSLSSIAPVIHNFDKVAPNPRALSLYFAATVLILAPKALFIFVWLNSSRIATYRHLVISPLTPASPQKVSEFIHEPARQAAPSEKQRSLTSRVIWSSLILLVVVGGTVTILHYGWQIEKDRRGPRYAELSELALGGVWLWFTWSVKWMTFIALLLAIAASVVRDYVVFFKPKVEGWGTP